MLAARQRRGGGNNYAFDDVKYIASTSLCFGEILKVRNELCRTERGNLTKMHVDDGRALERPATYHAGDEDLYRRESEGKLNPTSSKFILRTTMTVPAE